MSSGGAECSEQYWGPTGPAVSKTPSIGGASCGPTQTATPRQTNGAMADDALRRICGAFGDDIIRELIRAREMGQREGREDQQKVIESQRALITKREQEIARLQEQKRQILDARVAEEIRISTSLQNEADGLHRYINGLESKVSDMTRRFEAKLIHVELLETSVRTMASQLQTAQTVSQVVCRIPKMWGGDHTQVMKVESVMPGFSGLSIVVTV